MRVEKHAILTYEERPTVTFTFDGKELEGKEGEPIAAALIANGITILRYTEHEHAPRSLFCGIGQCMDCAMTVDGVPNVRTCITPLKAGMKVETQNGFGKAGVKL